MLLVKNYFNCSSLGVKTKKFLINITIFYLLSISNIAYSTEREDDFCQNLSKLSHVQITDKFLDKLFVNNYEEFHYLLSKIREGESGCFRAGIIIGENGRQFGANTYDVIDSLSNLADNNLEIFLKNSKIHHLSDELLIKILVIPDWMFSRTKIKDIKTSIAHRKTYINEITSNKKVIDEILKHYQDAQERLEKDSRRKLEYFHHTGARLVFLSKKQSLKSDKEYTLSNLVDNNINTAWCVLDDDKIDWGYLWVNFDLDKLNTFNFKCRDRSGINDRNECYFEEIVMKIRSGYQKNRRIFENNSRPAQITSTMRLKSKKNVNYKKILTLSDLDKEIKEFKLVFPIQQWASRSFTPIKIKIDFDKVKMGNKFDEMCISDLSFEIR